MAKIRMRHLIEKPSGYFFQATPKMRQYGIFSEPLGKDPGPAFSKAKRLNDEWDRIRAHLKAHGTPPSQRTEPSPGSLDHLIKKLRQSSEWRDKGARTRDEIEGELKVIQPLFGPTHVLDVSPDACLAFYDGLREKHSLNKAAKCMKWLRYLFNYAIRINYQGITHNPTAAVRIRKPAPRTQTWNEAQVEDAIQIAWIEGLRGAAVAIAIAYDTSTSGP